MINYSSKSDEREFPAFCIIESPCVVGADMGLQDCRLGAYFLKFLVGKYGLARYSDLSARKGIQVVPRK